MFTQGKKRGFTLIELLVVIAIIAILAAILFPAFAKAREAARKSSCSSNLKQIGVGIMQYAQNYDEILPTAANVGNVRGNWAQSTAIFVTNYDLFRCPSNTANTQNHGSAATGGVFRNTPRSYVANPRIIAQQNAQMTNFQNGINQAIIKRPGSLIMVGEGNVDAGDPWAVQPDGSQIGSLFAGHLGQSNFLFADGHVKAAQPSQTMVTPVGGGDPINNWGYFNDNNPLTCNADNTTRINCEEVSNTAFTALELVTKKYQ